MNPGRDINGQGREPPASTTLLGKGARRMSGRRTALFASLCWFVGCYSEDRPLNEYVTGGAAGTSNAAGSESNTDAGEAAGAFAGAGQGGSATAGTAGVAGSGLAGSTGATAGTVGGTSSGGTSGGGTSGDAGEASAGEGATPNIPVGALCNSSDGSGCGAGQFCIDAANDACDPDVESTCAGFCAEPAPRADLVTTCGENGCPDEFSCVTDPVEPQRSFCTGNRECSASAPCAEGFICGPDGICVPEKVACVGQVLCPAIVAPCSAGYTHSIVDECFGPCVPLESCACASDLDCVDKSASCDRLAGRCVVPKAPEPRCALPYETGDCLAAQLVFAFVDGSCQPQTYGGCGGNDNRFSSLSECRARCEGAPAPNECPAGSVLDKVCLGCGPADNCTHLQTLCTETCDENTECPSPFHWCYDGRCAAQCG